MTLGMIVVAVIVVVVLLATLGHVQTAARELHLVRKLLERAEDRALAEEQRHTGARKGDGRHLVPLRGPKDDDSA